MPRTLYQLEGQQLRLLRELADHQRTQSGLSDFNCPAGEIIEIIDLILAFGPTVEDEED